ncbi:Uncharacterized conserved protein YaaN involved in tellurite resistance [Algoriella xinjiangensis]|uniref:Uncharacterized conserved protein YaaN involved in tellurite resistance n=1 Tax=Algoriella xinjiangensis TaxID=684065 RepID=A0A1I4V914_9FLAO|nr:toxic anion resistance protein [Algoriella xinjiangensis]SFM97664.1 Uncharacterized conserved protein YaaN involved in tellurite resistance [Algoriella xinjiangensis]VDH17047.1 TelA-like protein SA1238 [Algoriella xinjiangensis]
MDLGQEYKPVTIAEADEPEVILTEEDKQKLELYKQKIDFNSTQNIIQYGLSSQNQISAFSDQILRQVRAKDLGFAKDILLDLRNNINSFDESLHKKSFFSFLETIKKRVLRFKSEYESIEKNITAIEIKLEKHYQILLKDINIFDKLFQQNQLYFKDLSLYIIAGTEKLKEMKEEVLPKMKEEVSTSTDQNKIQQYKDLEQQVNRFEKKLHDLKLTRMITLQTAPQIRMIQNNSSVLMEKIQSSIVNTLPLWKNHMVLTLGIAHTQDALDAQKAVTDATNELLQRNSEMLKESTIKIATESERGIVDIETIQKANSDIITTINEVLRIQEDGRNKRLTVEEELKKSEEELRSHLLNGENQKYIA